MLIKPYYQKYILIVLITLLYNNLRDEKVKHKILRIFKIWEQRGVYNEEFISDLCGLISVIPSGPKGDEPHEFQVNIPHH